MDDDSGDSGSSRRGELIAAGLTLLLGAGLVAIAVSVLRQKAPCGCEDQEGQADGA